MSFLEPEIEDFRRDEHGNLTFVSRIEIPDKYKAIKCTSTVEFYGLRGRSVKICKENLEPLFGMWYAIYAPPIAGDTDSYKYADRYFPRQLRDTDNYEESIKELRRYVKDGNLWLLLSQSDMERITETLQRLYRAYHKTEGQLDYRKQYIPLMENSIALELYIQRQKSAPDYMTKIKVWEAHIKSLYQIQ